VKHQSNIAAPDVGLVLEATMLKPAMGHALYKSRRLNNVPLSGYPLVDIHGENQFFASTKRFVDISPANQNCCGDNFTFYGDN